MESVFLILMVLLLHLVAGDGAAMYIKDSKQILANLSTNPYLIDMEAMRPKDLHQLFSSSQRQGAAHISFNP